MNAKDRREKYEEALKRQQEGSLNRKDDSGRFKSIYKDGADKSKFWKCNEGEHLIDIIPYEAGKNNPYTEEGEPTYVLDLWRHAGIGVNQDAFICMSRTFKKPCPICEWQAEARALGEDEEFVKSLNPSRRVIYNIHVLDNEVEKKKGIQIWEVAHWSFERNLVELASKAGKKITFASIKSGKNISFRRKGMKATNTEYTALSFETRANAIPDKVLDEAITLENIIHIPKYDEIVKVLPVNEITNKLFGKKSKSDADHDPEETKASSKSEDVKDFDGCPAGYDFGSDCGKYDDCQECDNYDECDAAFVKMEEEREAEERRKKEEEEKRKKEEPATPMERRRRRA